MTARKTTKKAPAKKKTGKTGKAAPKTSGKSGGKAPAARKKASKAPARKTAKKPAAAVQAPDAPAAGESAAKAPRPESSSLNVNLGHVFALRPRVSTTFRQADFHAARQRLQDDSFSSLAEAARAVAEKALELTHEGGARRSSKHRR